MGHITKDNILHNLNHNFNIRGNCFIYLDFLDNDRILWRDKFDINASRIEYNFKV